jgi:hypothetical protein
LFRVLFSTIGGFFDTERAGHDLVCDFGGQLRDGACNANHTHRQ